MKNITQKDTKCELCDKLIEKFGAKLVCPDDKIYLCKECMSENKNLTKTSKRPTFSHE